MAQPNQGQWNCQVCGKRHGPYNMGVRCTECNAPLCVDCRTEHNDEVHPNRSNA